MSDEVLGLQVEGLSPEEITRVCDLLQASGVQKELLESYIADLNAIIDAGFETYFQELN